MEIAWHIVAVDYFDVMLGEVDKGQVRLTHGEGGGSITISRGSYKALYFEMIRGGASPGSLPCGYVVART
jgi:hypothetical protein